MSVADTVVATAHPYYRHVRGRALGSTTLRLVADGMYEFDATIPVTVR